MAKEPNTAPKRVNGPRPAYLMFNKPLPEDIKLVAVTRKAEEALKMIDDGAAGSYQRCEIK